MDKEGKLMMLYAGMLNIVTHPILYIKYRYGWHQILKQGGTQNVSFDWYIVNYIPERYLIIAKDGWPLEYFKGHLFFNFIRIILHGRKLITYKQWRNAGGCKVSGYEE